MIPADDLFGRPERSPTAYPVHCAWCGAGIGQSTVDRSHGICAACFEQLVGIPLLTDAELGALPFGMIELDAVGTVRQYNAAEQALSGKTVQSVIGKNFFTDVAPCTAVSDFQGRFTTFMRDGGDPVSFTFTFPFSRGAVDVHIAFVRSNHETALVLVRAETGAATHPETVR